MNKAVVKIIKRYREVITAKILGMAREASNGDAKAENNPERGAADTVAA